MERPYNRARNDEIRALYAQHVTPKEIAFRLCMSIHVIYKAIERRVEDRRREPRNGKDRRR